LLQSTRDRGGNQWGLREDGEAASLSPGDLQLGQETGPICSLKRGLNSTLNKCVTDTPLSEGILPLMRSCFFGGAMHAVFLLQKGHGDQLASDITSFVLEQRQSRNPTVSYGSNLARGNSHDLRLNPISVTRNRIETKMYTTNVISRLGS
jgi:hypothetical protein